MGAQTDVTAADVRWLTPLPLWTGILAGPVAWSSDLAVSYALVKWSCLARREDVLHLVTAGALALVAGGAVVAWSAFQRTRGDRPEDGGDPRQRARFMAMLGLASSAFFAVATVALAIPWWVLDACH